MELWKDIPNYEGLYQINIKGEVKSFHTNKLKTIFQRKSVGVESLHVGLNKNGKTKTYKINRLLYEVFNIKDLEDSNLDGEVWIPIKDWENSYEVSNKGRVRSLDRYIQQRNKNGEIMDRFMRGKVLSTKRNNGNGYRIVQLKDGAFDETVGNEYIHILVAEHFIENPLSKLTVNHKDLNKGNNSVCNLEWATSKEQSEHAIENGAYNKRIDKIESEIIKNAYRSLVYENETYKNVSLKYDISKNYLYSLKNKEFRLLETDFVDDLFKSNGREDSTHEK